MAVTTGNYKEACRLIRVEGVFRTAADMNNDYFALLATEDLASASNYGGSSVPDNTATASYQQFVIDYMDKRFTNEANTQKNHFTGSRPCGCTARKRRRGT